MKDNKLIAEFMGRDDIYQGMSEARAKRIYNYHNSWDWLMPVIEKCYILNDEHDFTAFDDFCNFDIRLTYDNVIDFINQYNKENESNNK